MKALATGLYSKASGSAFLTAVNGRFYKVEAPTGAEYPHAVYRIVTEVPDKTFSERYEAYDVQFSLFSSKSSSEEIEDLFLNLKSLYEECTLTVAGYTLVWIRIAHSTGAEKEDWITPSGTQKVWAIHTTFEVMLSLN